MIHEKRMATLLSYEPYMYLSLLEMVSNMLFLCYLKS